ncbi:MAG TPA: hypothetical protein VIV11_23665 [Kofleriaceae bacterium]
MGGARHIVLVVVAGCSFPHGTPATTDGGGDAGDAGTDTPPTCSFGPWSAPVPLTELNAPGVDNAPWLTDDELTIYFVTDRVGDRDTDWDIFTATRMSIDLPFGTPVILPQINTNRFERNLSLTADQLTMFFASDRPGTLGAMDLWMVTRATTTDMFESANVTHLPNLSSAATDYFPTTSADGLTLYFSSNRGAASDLDIYRTRRGAPNDGFDSPEAVAVLNTGGGEAAMGWGQDERTLFVQSDRTPSQSWDVWVATRPDVASELSPLTHVPELSTPKLDFARWMSRDGKRVYIAATPVGTLLWDLFVASRECQ